MARASVPSSMRSSGRRGAPGEDRGGVVSGSESPANDEDEDEEVSSSVLSAERSNGV